MTGLETYFYEMELVDIYKDVDKAKTTIEETMEEMDPKTTSKEKGYFRERIEYARMLIIRSEKRIGEFRICIVKMIRCYADRNIYIEERRKNMLTTGAIRLPNKVNHVKKLFNNLVAAFNRIWNAREDMLDIVATPTGAVDA